MLDNGLITRFDSARSVGLGRVWAPLVLVVLLLAAQAQAKGHPGDTVDRSKLTKQEAWVLEQVKKGEVADLKWKFGEAEENRHLSARFLEKLLTGGFKNFPITRQGVRIYYAVFDKPVNLENVEISQDVYLECCLFRGKVILYDCHFKKQFSIRESHFFQEAKFHRLKSQGTTFCRGTSFWGPVDFTAADIRGDFSAEGAQFNNEEKDAIFNRMKVRGYAVFDGAVFWGPVDFGWADIKGNFDANGAQFFNDTKMANFNSMKVGQSARFNGLRQEAIFQGPVSFISNAVFQGPVDFGGADFGGVFEANGAQFLNDKVVANFNHMKVGQAAFFTKAIFQGPVDFSFANIGVNLEANGAQFLNDSNDAEKACFNTMKVRNYALFNNAEFHRPVDFRYADIGGNFEADGAQFLNEGKESAIFSDLKVGQSAFFDKVTFKGAVDFFDADIGSLFDFNGAQFLNETQSATFQGIKIGRDARFNLGWKEDQFQAPVEEDLISNATFFGPVEFGVADIRGNFEATGAKFFNNREDSASFFGMKVGQSAFVDMATFKGGVDFGGADIGRKLDFTWTHFLNKDEEVKFDSMMVRNSAIFNKTTFIGEVDFRFSSLQIFEWEPATYSSVRLLGLTYKNILFGDNWKVLLKLLEKSPNHAQPYSQLVSFFQQRGYPDRADKVSIIGKQRGWWETWSWGEPWQWPLKALEKIFFDCGVGYGRHPGRVFYFSAIFVFLGTIIFSRPGVLTWEGGRPFQRIKLKRAFWYSLDAYLPFISLGPDKFYQLSPEAKVSWTSFIPQRALPLFPDHIRIWLTDHHLSGTIYFYIHQLAGYVLVSIGVAAITGIIK